MRLAPWWFLDIAFRARLLPSMSELVDLFEFMSTFCSHGSAEGEMGSNHFGRTPHHQDKKHESRRKPSRISRSLSLSLSSPFLYVCVGGRVLMCVRICDVCPHGSSAASHVILLNPWWTPAAEKQAIDRVHCLGLSSLSSLHGLSSYSAQERPNQ